MNNRPPLEWKSDIKYLEVILGLTFTKHVEYVCNEKSLFKQYPIVLTKDVTSNEVNKQITDKIIIRTITIYAPVPCGRILAVLT